EDGADLARAVRALDGFRTRELPMLAPIPPGCAAIAVFGPRRPFAPAEARELEAWLDRGGRLLVAVDPLRDGGVLGPTGLEGLLGRAGVKRRAGAVVDPGAEIGAPLAWATLNGYSSHPVTAAWRGRRLSIWYEPRWVEPLPLPGVRAQELVTSSAQG